ncbi:hypothetical protein [Frankia sp. Cas3]|uniref:hypothetical protein n=1 Tax=Frankia sp. Cas3 TaxID=3073926 RepID=UPI002AD25D4C|nr:hypothetical protein [Frankia sp. Cas3]
MARHRRRSSTTLAAARAVGVFTAVGMTAAVGLAPAAEAATAPAADTGTGSVTVSIVEPVAVSGTAVTTVTCTTGHVYQASVTSVPVNGDVLSFTVRAPGYHGPGNYPAVVTAQLTESDGTVVTLPAGPVPTTITATGGSTTIDGQTPNGIPVDASVAWVCTT